MKCLSKKSIRNSLLLICALLFADSAMAEWNYFYPRGRFFSELGRDTSLAPSRPGRRTNRRVRDTKFEDPGVYDVQAFRSGAMAGWASDYVWRDFHLSTSDAVFGAEAHVGWMGFETSVFATSDGSNQFDASNPHQLDYRLSYTFKALTSVNTLAVEYHDFSNIADKLGLEGQGFGENAPKFEDTLWEVSLSNYWFNDTIQLNAANYYLGFDAWYSITDGGLRGQAVAGIVGVNHGEALYIPNGARVQAALIGQHKYYRDDTSMPGGAIFGEIYWDGQEENYPFMMTAGIEYFSQLEKHAVDRMSFYLRFEIKIRGFSAFSSE